MQRQATGRDERVKAWNLDRIDGSGEWLSDRFDDPDPRRFPVPSISRRRDSLELRERRPNLRSIARVNEVEQLLDLLGARDPQPVRVTRRLPWSADPQRRNDTDISE